MSGNKRHHYVPEFLLAQWCGADGRLSGFRRDDNGSFAPLHVLPKETAMEGHLYALEHVPGELRQAIEKDFFTAQIDTPASLVHAKLLAGGNVDLSRLERETWSRFLIASRARVPEWVHLVRREGRQRAEEALLAGQAEFLAIKGNAPEATLLDWALKRRPELIANAGISALTQVISNTARIEEFAAMSWIVLDLSKSTAPVLISDRPAIATAGIDSPDFAFVLPLAPHRIFVAVKRPAIIEHLIKQPHGRLARQCNESSVTQARRCVYGRVHFAFVRKRFGKGWADGP